MAADGSCLQRPDEREVRELARRIECSVCLSVAICFLHACANADNERQVADWVAAEAPMLDISISSDVSPRIREYERTNTVVANAYVRSAVKNYIDHLLSKLQESDFQAELQIMQSNGGLAPAAICRDYPVRLLESGPAAGVLMCTAVCKAEQIKQVLTFDMGGTTAKFGAIDNGEAAVTPSFAVDLTDYRRVRKRVGSGTSVS